MIDIQTRAFNLMKLWCGTLLKYEVRNDSKYLDGALLCPACHVVHGRIADLVLPLTTLWAHTGEERYLEAAERLVNWAEFNLRRPDGSLHNDAGNQWKGTTAFFATALGDSLMLFGDRLPKETAILWQKIFYRVSEFCYSYFDHASPNINYFAGAAAELALAWKYFGEQRFLEKANYWEQFCREHFDENGLFYGEGHPVNITSAKGCFAIDMGYNLEESLPLLLRHAVLVNDAEKLDFYKARLLDHLEFLLPDGAIDNSFGSRHNKWTYWGSRTSDGLIEGLALVMNEPVFAKACDRILSLWETCTNNGLLGLPMASEAGEPTCLHHSFCHAKALAALVNENIYDLQKSNIVLLPREHIYGFKTFQKGNVRLVSVGGWRATFNSSDLIFYAGADNGGGSMTLLWHDKIGPICAATMQRYVPSEPLNMQYLRSSDVSPCMTPQLIIDGKQTVADRSAKISASGDENCTEIQTFGSGWSAIYRFTPNEINIIAEVAKSAVLSFPIICSKNTKAETGDGKLRLANGLTISADRPIETDTVSRIFNQVGGFEYIPIEIEFDKRIELKITIE